MDINNTKAARQLAAEASAMAAAEELQNKIAKLPKWASEHIEHISRERAAAINTLNQFQDAQTPSAVSFQEMVSTGEQGRRSFKTRYIQSDEVRFEAHGLNLTVRIGMVPGDPSLNLTYGGGSRFIGAECALIPMAFQQFRLVAKENIRD